MPYLMSDDRKPWHPKVLPLSDAAYRLNDTAKHYAAAELTDGFLLPVHIQALPKYRKAVLAELLRAAPSEAPLIHNLGEGCGTKTCPAGREGYYLIHNYLKWNKPRTWWENKRRKDAERLANWRAAHAEPNGGQTS